MSEFKKYRLTKSKKMTRAVKILRFELNGTSNHKPGQYYRFRLVNKDHSVVDRDYSIVNSTYEKHIEFCVEKLKNGAMSPYLHNLKIGESVLMKGPLGDHFVFNDTSNQIAFISSGTGVAPFLSYLKSAKVNKSKSLLSFKTRAEILFSDILKNTSLTITRETPKNWNGYLGRINKKMIIEVFGKNAKNNFSFYISGSSVFVENIKQILTEIGVDEEKIKMEYFG